MASSRSVKAQVVGKRGIRTPSDVFNHEGMVKSLCDVFDRQCDVLDDTVQKFCWKGKDYSKARRSQGPDRLGLSQYNCALAAMLDHAPGAYPSFVALRNVLCDLQKRKNIFGVDAGGAGAGAGAGAAASADASSVDAGDASSSTPYEHELNLASDMWRLMLRHLVDLSKTPHARVATCPHVCLLVSRIREHADIRIAESPGPSASSGSPPSGDPLARLGSLSEVEVDGEATSSELSPLTRKAIRAGDSATASLPEDFLQSLGVDEFGKPLMGDDGAGMAEDSLMGEEDPILAEMARTLARDDDSDESADVVLSDDDSADETHADEDMKNKDKDKDQTDPLRSDDEEVAMSDHHDLQVSSGLAAAGASSSSASELGAIDGDAGGPPVGGGKAKKGSDSESEDEVVCTGVKCSCLMCLRGRTDLTVPSPKGKGKGEPEDPPHYNIWARGVTEEWKRSVLGAGSDIPPVSAVKGGQKKAVNIVRGEDKAEKAETKLAAKAAAKDLKDTKAAAKLAAKEEKGKKKATLLDKAKEAAKTFHEARTELAKAKEAEAEAKGAAAASKAQKGKAKADSKAKEAKEASGSSAAGSSAADGLIEPPCYLEVRRTPLIYGIRDAKRKWVTGCSDKSSPNAKKVIEQIIEECGSGSIRTLQEAKDRREELLNSTEEADRLLAESNLKKLEGMVGDPAKS